ncbi:MAG TPA: response regulator [Gammaproteobacteria bacterium]|nr:response regulator [Gammaproteobacteria bacterium]
MTLDPELLKQLIESFSTELAEHAEVITKGLLALEKNNLSEEDSHKTIETIFRAAHNIKGTAFSLGMIKLGEIAHSIESIFSDIQKKTTPITPETIDTCLNAVDQMRIEFDVFLKEKNNTPSSDAPETTENIGSHAYDSIRIPLNQVEKMSSLLEEIQIKKIVLMENCTDLPQLTENMRASINDLSLLLHAIQEEFWQFRMVPFGNFLCLLPRHARDISHEMHKKVELIFRGEDVKVDKAVLEGLKDPILHLLRNAIDHGIEPSDIRKKMGKPDEGRITIEISEEQAFIKIRVTDDGAGMDVRKIETLAIRKNIVSDADLNAMTDSEKLDLIFRPGFSTKEIITDISGRGVGLDIVKSNVENLKGHVTVETIPRKETTFTLRVPLSIATDRGLLIKNGNHSFVVPTASVERVLLVHPEERIHIQGGQAIRIEDKIVPIRSLSDVLDLEKSRVSNEKKWPVMVIRRGLHALAFLVDEILGEKEIVIKSLHEPFNRIPCVSGGTLIENNQVVIVLDPNALIERAMNQESTHSLLSEQDDIREPEKKHILVVDDSITTRTLEKNVLESKNYQVTVAVNGKEAWDILQKQSFSLLITDVVMPVMDGFTLTEQVKSSEHLRSLPVIIVTSLGSEEEKKHGIEVGADAYIIKNEFESGALLSIVSQLV